MTPAPKRRWLRLGEPWGLLAKTNPRATSRSVAIHAMIGALGGTSLWLALQNWKFGWALPTWTVLIAAAGAAGIAAIFEWQVDDDDEDVC